MSADLLQSSPVSIGPSRPLTLVQKSKPKPQPPLAYENITSRRKHGRSSSLGDFVSSILPSQRKERGYALRAYYHDDGTHLPSDLVFGLATEPDQGVSSKRAGSWSPRKDVRIQPTPDNGQGDVALNACEKSTGNAILPADGNDNGDTRGRSSTNAMGLGNDKGKGKNARSFGKFFGFKKANKRGEGTHLNSYVTSPTTHPTVQMPIYHVEKEPLLDVNMELSKAQRIFEDKKARREKRRSLQASGDFLGVQGANPRTGYWDVSTGTSSSEPSQMSEETKRKLDRETREVEESKRKWEEAQMKHEVEMERVHRVRQQKRKEREEQKKLEVKLKQRRHGKWRLSENGWSSVAEPDLSPIVQSLAGSPVRETSPSDRLFPMPTATDPTPYMMTQASSGEGDYFGHQSGSVLLTTAQVKLEPPSGPRPPLNSSIRRKPVGSPPSRNQTLDYTILRKNVALSLKNTASPLQLCQPPSLVSSNAHLPNAEITDGPMPATATQPSNCESGTQLRQQRPFLDREALPLQAGNQGIKKAIASSYQSASTSQVVTRRPLGPNLKDGSPGKRIMSLNDFPPIFLKDPIMARIPSSSVRQPNPLAVWAPPTITDPDSPSPRRIFTTTPTTTITGYGPLQDHPTQFDGPMEFLDQVQLSPSLQRRLRHVPVRTSSHQNNRLSNRRNSLSRLFPVDTGTSSGHQLAQTKNRTARLCRNKSPEQETMELRSTLTSIYTSPQTPERGLQGAQNAALVAYQNSRRKSTVEQMKGWTLPKLRMPVPDLWRGVDHDFMVIPSGLGDIGDPSRSRSSLHEKTMRTEKGGWEDDDFLVWHPSPNANANGNAENKNKNKNQNRNSRAGMGTGQILQLQHNQQRSPVRITQASANAAHKHRHSQGEVGVVKVSPYTYMYRGTPRPGQGSPQAAVGRGVARGVARVVGRGVDLGLGRVLLRVMQTIWWFVGPVFEPDSDLRKRWERRRLTWQDRGLFLAAGVFMVGVVLVTAVCARIVGLSVQALKGFLGIFRSLIGA